jgi:predicted nuclease with TOPRIM domain
MHTKKKGYFLSVLLLLSAFICTVSALPDTTVTFRGGGVTIEMTFPEEAHPNATITHNVTVTAHTDLTLQSFTLFIYAPINSSLQEIKNRTITWDFLENENLTSRIEFQLPQNTNGTLYCVMTVQTDQTTDSSSYKFYTTHVSDLTFSEMQSLYNEMLANYTGLQENYTTLLSDYDSLLANYSSLFANYTALLSQYNALSSNYNDRVTTYQILFENYNTLSGEYDALDSNYKSKINEFDTLQSDCNDLNSTHNSLQANYTTLQTDYNTLNQTYTGLQGDYNRLQGSFSSSQNDVNNDKIVMLIFVIALVSLIAFIIYLKRGKEEPYVVIRKETVSMNQDENPDQSNQT